MINALEDIRGEVTSAGTGVGNRMSYLSARAKMPDGLLERAPQRGGDSGNVTSFCTECPARSLGFCGNLDDGIIARLSERSGRIAIAANASLRAFRESGELGILISGILRSVHFSAEGDRRIVGITLPGEVFDPAEITGRYDMEAAVESRVCRISAASYKLALRDSHAVRLSLLRQTRSKIERLHSLQWSLAALSPEQRVAAFLVNCTRFMPWQPQPDGSGVLTIGMDRTDIADLLGTTVETISRITHRFDGEGLIRIFDARHFLIPDLELLALRSVSGRAGETPNRPPGTLRIVGAEAEAR